MWRWVLLHIKRIGLDNLKLIKDVRSSNLLSS